MMINTNILYSYVLLFASPLFLSISFAKKPNILFILSDDQSHRSVGCYPESPDWVKTPHIDSLARDGVRFAHCYMSSWCMAARATLLTGHQSYGVKSMRMEGEYPGSVYNSDDCPFWPSVFRKNGYQTAQIGKWHTGIDNGFDGCIRNLKIGNHHSKEIDFSKGRKISKATFLGSRKKNEKKTYVLLSKESMII